MAVRNFAAVAAIVARVGVFDEVDDNYSEDYSPGDSNKL